VSIFNEGDRQYEDAIAVVPIGTDTGPKSNRADYKLVVYGDLEVKGATRSLSATNTEYTDADITLNAGAANVNGSSGIAINRGVTVNNASWRFYEAGDDSYWAPDQGFNIRMSGNSQFLGSASATGANNAYSFEGASGTGFSMLNNNEITLSTNGTPGIIVNDSQLTGIGGQPNNNNRLTVNTFADTMGSVRASHTSTTFTGTNITSITNRAPSPLFFHSRFTSNTTDVFSVRGDGETKIANHVYVNTNSQHNGIDSALTVSASDEVGAVLHSSSDSIGIMSLHHTGS
jgi:hypothetical protein